MFQFFFGKMIGTSEDSEKPIFFFFGGGGGVFGWNFALWQKLWAGIDHFVWKWAAARASLALCSRVDQFRSPYSGITKRRSLHKRRVFDFVPSYREGESKVERNWFSVSANGNNVPASWLTTQCLFARFFVWCVYAALHDVSSYAMT